MVSSFVLVIYLFKIELSKTGRGVLREGLVEAGPARAVPVRVVLRAVGPRRSVRPSIRPSVHLSIHPFTSLYLYRTFKCKSKGVGSSKRCRIKPAGNRRLAGGPGGGAGGLYSRASSAPGPMIIIIPYKLYIMCCYSISCYMLVYHML